MNIEVFSLRSSQEDINSVSDNLERISDELAKDGFIIKYKTEVDISKQRIKKAISASAESDSKPDMIVIANALSSCDSSSFKTLFADIISEFEDEIQDPPPAKSKKKKIDSTL